MVVNFMNPAIHQLLSYSKGIIQMFNVVVKPFLKSFCVEEENGLSPFCRDFSSKEEIKHWLELLFPNNSKTSNKTTIVDYNDNDKESINI